MIRAFRQARDHRTGRFRVLIKALAQRKRPRAVLRPVGLTGSSRLLAVAQDRFGE